MNYCSNTCEVMNPLSILQIRRLLHAVIFLARITTHVSTLMKLLLHGFRTSCHLCRFLLVATCFLARIAVTQLQTGRVNIEKNFTWAAGKSEPSRDFKRKYGPF